ncbi:zinc permease (plasmid) [Mycolicibacterium crocinum]|uniref:Zinc permease n=1 Tax=Mycolicibacterium crocinum TaxID=388459 RepID=A0ABY3TW34_9MYCO|nr:zinc permease [Mycolicibacterium crocinum]ULN44834.1 zinc permease [Mycolicibacterium crocinum]
MSPTQIAVLGAIAGATIFLGLPIGRLRAPMPRLKTGLNAVATGVLVFLLWDVLAHAWQPIDEALSHHEIGAAVGNGAMLAATVGVGLLGLVWIDRFLSRHRIAPVSGPGAASVAEFKSASWTDAAGRLALMIATGIGLHNFAEGLAIGNSAAAGDLSLAVLLVIGFGLHNATEGFGIVAPLTGQRPSWGFLALLGLIGGGPTFVGTLIGQRFVNDTVSIAFLGLAAGSILYVVIELLAVARTANLKTITTWGIFAGLILGFATDAVLTAAGA